MNMQNNRIGRKIGKYVALPLLALTLMKTGCDYWQDQQKGNVITTYWHERPIGRVVSGSRMVLYDEKADADAQFGIDYSNMPASVLRFNRKMGIDVDIPFDRSSGKFWVPEGLVKRGYEKNIIEKETRFLNILDWLGIDE